MKKHLKAKKISNLNPDGRVKPLFQRQMEAYANDQVLSTRPPFTPPTGTSFGISSGSIYYQSGGKSPMAPPLIRPDNGSMTMMSPPGVQYSKLAFMPWDHVAEAKDQTNADTTSNSSTSTDASPETERPPTKATWSGWGRFVVCRSNVFVKVTPVAKGTPVPMTQTHMRDFMTTPTAAAAATADTPIAEAAVTTILDAPTSEAATAEPLMVAATLFNPVSGTSTPPMNSRLCLSPQYWDYTNPNPSPVSGLPGPSPFRSPLPVPPSQPRGEHEHGHQVVPGPHPQNRHRLQQ